MQAVLTSYCQQKELIFHPSNTSFSRRSLCVGTFPHAHQYLHTHTCTRTLSCTHTRTLTQTLPCITQVLSFCLQSLSLQEMPKICTHMFPPKLCHIVIKLLNWPIKSGILFLMYFDNIPDEVNRLLLYQRNFGVKEVRRLKKHLNSTSSATIQFYISKEKCKTNE